jgi:thiamine-monophosphate kinase
VAGKKARPGEFELIERYFRPLARAPGAFSLLDDAALIRPPHGADLVITADIVAENVHFFADDPASSIARKALSVNLSDLAGKGAEPAAYLLSIALRDDFTEAWIAAFASGLRDEQERYGVSLIGGDTTRAAGGTTVAITAIGSLPEGTMVHRSGARPGDLVFVSGTVGDGALGLLLRLGKLDPAMMGEGASHLLDRYLHPRPRVALAPVIRRFATSSMDVSDG